MLLVPQRHRARAEHFEDGIVAESVVEARAPNADRDVAVRQLFSVKLELEQVAEHSCWRVSQNRPDFALLGISAGTRCVAGAARRVYLPVRGRCVFFFVSIPGGCGSWKRG
jgi:hypothetical protein